MNENLYGFASMDRLKLALSVALISAASIAGLAIGIYGSRAYGPEFAAKIPALELAARRANFIAESLRGFFESMGIAGPRAATISLGIGIFVNNAAVAAVIAFSPFLILGAKPFSDKYLAFLYYRHGIWLFKPIGWAAYRALALILPLYGLALQSYLIGGMMAMRGLSLDGAEFIFLEAASVTAVCASATAPPLSKKPDQSLSRYLKLVRGILPPALLALFAAAILEAEAIARVSVELAQSATT